jgi:hypothetical protein
MLLGKLLITRAQAHGPWLALSQASSSIRKGLTVNTREMTGGTNFLIWMALWIAALMVLLPALAGS